MKKLLICLLCLMLMPAAHGEEQDPLSFFGIRNGRRDEKKIALTVDDSFALDWTWEIRDLFRDLGVVGTFFPVGVQVHPEDRENWQLILDYGNEIGSHNIGHYKMGGSSGWDIVRALGRFQEALDAALGYHYQVNAFRPPFGNASDENGNGNTFRHAVQLFGYEHVILWDVSQTDPEQALHKVQNGSILLYHARQKDYNCLKVLIPRLQAEGYEFVTISQLCGFGENEISPEPYVFRKEDYEKKD